MDKEIPNQGATDGENQLDFECEKIFHPEKFDIAKFTEDGGASVDEGARFYGKSRKESDLLQIPEDGNKPNPQSLPWRIGGEEGPVLSYPGTTDKPILDSAKEETGRNIGSSVQFQVGVEEEEEGDGGDDKDHRKEEHWMSSRQKHRNANHMNRESLNIRRTVGSDIALSQMGSGREATEMDEAQGLKQGDLDDIGSHRFEKSSHVKHKIIEKETIQIGSDTRVPGNDNPMLKKMYGFQKDLDHTPHELFVEMDELQGDTWVEKSRWVKYEEDLEEGSHRWGKPHVASLSFHSLINLRVCLENCALILDFDAKDFPGVVYRMVEELNVLGHIEEDQKSQILRVLLFRHKHVHNRGLRYGIKRSISQKSVTGLMPDDKKYHRFDMEAQSGMSLGETGLVASESSGSLHKKSGDGHSILDKMADGTEGTTVLVGSLDDIKRPIVSLVRLANAIMMPNTMEVSVPVRFIFIVFTPKSRIDMDHYEIGRAFSTLMSNPGFHNMCYKMEEMRECLHALNMFLDDSIVLPPGNWDTKHLIPMTETFAKIRQRKKAQNGEVDNKDDIKDKGDGDQDNPPKRNPMDRVSMPFGGLVNDVKQRYPNYLSDITDGFDTQCLAAALFIYFACLSGAIAFGGLLGEKTKGEIGIPETIIVSAVAGLIFALFSGCPLIITGVTGPVLLFDDALYQFTESNDIDYLPWRVWIGIWLLIIALLVAFFQGSTLVKYFTRFTKDIFAALVALLFIFEAFKKLIKIFKKHPLHSLDYYCEIYENNTLTISTGKPLPTRDEPNTALMSAILMFGTFFLAYFLRLFRNSSYFGRNVRRALGDFGVPIAITIMVLLDFAGGDALHTEKLKVPEGLKVTDANKRGWLINPLGGNKMWNANGTSNIADGEFFYPVPAWEIFAGALPAILLYLLLFMETHICELIMMDKTKEVKGAGLHLDIVLLCVINCVGAFFGGPWICAATVRAVSHVSALTVMSTTHAPGDAPKVVGVKDQRLSASVVSIMLGVSVLLSPVLKHVPFAVLFGVFLYMGQSGMNGVQFFDRLFLTIKPQKYHPQVTYVKKVKTWRMNLFTLFQLVGLAILWVVKSIPAIALAFPFFVIAMIPYRMTLKFFFTRQELNALDGADAGKEESGNAENEDDFYETAGGVPAMLQALPFTNANHDDERVNNGLPSNGATNVGEM